MPLHGYAEKAIERIGRKNKILIITARSKECDEPTKQWLFTNRIVYDEYINFREMPKSTHKPNVLIDDYIGHVKDFLQETDGFAVLFSQPWNKNLEELEKWEGSNRLLIAKNWKSVPPFIKQIKAST